MTIVIRVAEATTAEHPLCEAIAVIEVVMLAMIIAIRPEVTVVIGVEEVMCKTIAINLLLAVTVVIESEIMETTVVTKLKVIASVEGVVVMKPN